MITHLTFSNDRKKEKAETTTEPSHHINVVKLFLQRKHIRQSFIKDDGTAVHTTGCRENQGVKEAILNSKKPFGGDHPKTQLQKHPNGHYLPHNQCLPQK